MKATLICPKCEGRLIWRIDAVRVTTTDSTRRGGMTMTPARVAAKVHFGFGRAEAIGSFEAFICKTCGYTEWYANGLEQLEPDADAGIQLIDNRPGSGLR